MKTIVANALKQREQYKKRSHVRTRAQMAAFDEGVETGLVVCGMIGTANEYQEEVEKLTEGD